MIYIKDIQISQNDDEDITTNKLQVQDDRNNDHTIKLGDSALQWIESAKRKKRSDTNCGVVGIQQNHDEEAFSPTSTLKLTKPNTKKRSRTGSEQSEVLIEESSSDVKKCGQVVQSEEGTRSCRPTYQQSANLNCKSRAE